MHRSTCGKISIVGAGPGDPELITVKGLRAIQSADAILYDALSSEALLDHAKDGADLIYVGKRCGQHSLKQTDINALLIAKSRQYQHVVRLKGGDPFVFGRGHEEYVSLSNKGLEVEVIPGISSALSLPLLQKVPLTRRHVSESFWVLTGTTKDHDVSADLYDAAKSNATVVILMGMNKLYEITQIFKQEGKSNLGTMIVTNGSRNNEEVVLGTVENICESVKRLTPRSPGIIVIGEVVSLHPKFVNQVKKLAYENI